MNELIVKASLKQELDKIDSEIIEIASGYLQEGRYTVLIGIWRKGEAVGGSIAIDTSISFRELERQTGRDRKDLKRWHDLYKE
ncbi:unnamed protein product, partial [marine sediment metagenome]